jgi:hypothetical protein
VLALVTGALLVVVAPAWGGVRANSVSAESVTSASWGAAGSTTNGSPTPGSPFTISWAIITLLPTSQYFKVTNTGTLALTGETYSAVNSGGPTVVLTACVGAAWSATTGACGGTQVSLGQSGGGAVTSTTAIPVGGSLSVRAQTTGLLSLGTFTTSVTVDAARSQVRAGTTTNS